MRLLPFIMRAAATALCYRGGCLRCLPICRRVQRSAYTIFVFQFISFLLLLFVYVFLHFMLLFAASRYCCRLVLLATCPFVPPARLPEPRAPSPRPRAPAVTVTTRLIDLSSMPVEH